LEIIADLSKHGAVLSVFDPLVQEVRVSGSRAGSVEEAVREADGLLMLVAHKPFRTLQPEMLRPFMRKAVAIDCQNGWNRAAWEAAGFQFHLLGDGNRPSSPAAQI
jgi:UDP-N-acetyl-D-mannosaminuronic acid dehydrogenase